MKGAETDAQVKQHLHHVNDRPFNDLRYPMDSGKLQQLGWTPKVSWQDGIQRTSMLYLSIENIIYMYNE